MQEDILSVKDAVELVLQESNKARNDDKWLIVKVLEKMGHTFIDYDNLKDLPSFESITRCRRKFQEENKYLPEQDVELFRLGEQEKMKRIKEWF